MAGLMTYLPPSLFRPALLSGVRPLGLLFSSGYGDECFVVAGSMAVFLVGSYAGEAFEQRVAENWAGLAIEDLQVEVDISSRYSLDKEQPRLLSVLRRNTGLLLYANVKHRGGFPQRTRVELVANLPAGDGDLTEAFSRWRLVAQVEDEWVAVYTHEPSEPT